MKYCLPVILLISIAASAQVVRYDNFAATTTSASGIGNILQAIPSATVTVFNYPGSAVSCAGGGCVAATTYTNKSATTTCGGGLPLTRPTSITCLSTADLQGNFGFWAAAGQYQYCISAPSFTTQCTNVVIGAGGNVATIVNGPGDPTWAGSDDGARINTAIANIVANSPTNTGTIWITPGNYSLATTISLNSSNIQLRCLGGSFSFGNGPTCNFKWTGASGGIMVSMGQTSAGTSGLMFDGFFLNANSLAQTCVKINSVNNSVIQNWQCGNWIAAANTGALLVTTTNASGQGVSVNHFENITLCCGAANGANGAWITGTLTLDAFHNTWINVSANVSANAAGEAWHIENGDHDVYWALSAGGGSSTGIGLHLTCQASATSNALCARGETFYQATFSGSGGTAAVKQDGNSGFFPSANYIRWDICDSGGIPSATQIVNGTITVDTDDCSGAADEGQYRFGQITGTSYLTSQLLNTGSGSASFLTLNRPNASFNSNLITFDSPGLPAQSLCSLYNDSGTGKWTLCKNSSNNFVLFDGAAGITRATWTTNGSTIFASPNNSGVASQQFQANQGSNCTNGELVLSAGWGTTATVTAVVGVGGQTCEWTITSSGTGQAANPTITDTLTNSMFNASVCDMRMVGGTGAATLIDQTTTSATAPVFTFGGTPAAASTYKVVRRCGP